MPEDLRTGGGNGGRGLHVLIIGTGITGLLVAQGLKKAGINHSIFEREPSASHIRPREWGLSIHWSLPYLERVLPDDLFARLGEVQNDPFFDPPVTDVLPIYNGKTGEHIKDMPLPKVVRVSRRKMREFCAQGVDVKYGKALTDVTYSPEGKGVTASFADGTTAFGDVLVGADGPQSKVRELLLGNEEASVKPVGLVLSNIEVKYNDAEKALFARKYHPIYYMALHPNGVFSWVSIQDVPDPEKPETWTFQLMCSWLGSRDRALSSAGLLADLKKRHEDFAEPFRSVNLWIPEGTPMAHNTIAYWITKPWDDHNGRMALAGDAAHPLPPHRGQGLNQSICDASRLVAALTKAHAREETLGLAVSEYCEEVVQRGADEVTTSRDNALMLHRWDKVLESPLMKRSAAPNKEKAEEGARVYYGEPQQGHNVEEQGVGGEEVRSRIRDMR